MKMRSLIHKYTVIIILNLIILLSCTERDRSNPFDPGNNVLSPIELFIYPSNNTVRLNWIVKNVSDYIGFRLYRAIDNENFELFKELSPDITNYMDTTLVYYHWYRYRIAIMGYSQETPPSNSVKMLCGPGKIWVLSRYGYSIREMSYDLLHTNQLYTTNYPAINWDWNSSESEIWMANAQYRYISKLNLNIGHEDNLFFDDFQRPIDIKWDNNLSRVTVLDPATKKIFVVNNQTVLDTITLANDQFFKILLTPQSEIITIDTQSVCIFNEEGDLRTTLHFQAGFRGSDIISDGTNLYFLSVDEEQSKSILGTYNLNSGNLSQLEISGIFNVIRKPRNNNYFWLAEIIDNNSSRGVKLSINGIRLLELSSLRNFIDDIKINPYDESVVLLQNYENNIVIYDSTGQKLSNNNQIYDPVKVYIE